MGMIVGTSLQTIILCIIVWKTNWEEEVILFINFFLFFIFMICKK